LVGSNGKIRKKIGLEVFFTVFFSGRRFFSTARKRPNFLSLLPEASDFSFFKRNYMMKRKRALLFPLHLVWLPALSIALLWPGCKKDEDKPVLTYVVTCTVSSAGVLDMEEITYVDEDGVEQVITDKRDINLVFEAQSGARLKLTAKGNLTQGSVSLSMKAQVPGPGGAVLFDSENAVNAGAPAIPFNLSAEFTLP
jgi:hypothetical protein